MHEYGRLVAYVNPDGCSGPILHYEEVFAMEIESIGRDISDNDLPKPAQHGLMLFEGWLEVGAGPDPDVAFVGQWRRLTHWELTRLNFGSTPWEPTAAIKPRRGKA